MCLDDVIFKSQGLTVGRRGEDQEGKVWGRGKTIAMGSTAEEGGPWPSPSMFPNEHPFCTSCIFSTDP